MGSEGVLTPQMAQAIIRLATVRAQMRQLESEEQTLRQSVLEALASWPDSAYPIRVGHYEVRLTRRAGRVDYEAAAGVLDGKNLLESAPVEPIIKDPQACVALRRAVTELAMPKASRKVLSEQYFEALAFRPVIHGDWLKALCENEALDLLSYAECFKDGKPVLPVLVVR